MIKKLHIIIFVLLLNIVFNVNGQNQKEIDSLNDKLQKHKVDSNYVKISIELIDKYLFTNPDTTLLIIENCEKEAIYINYKWGIAECLQRRGTVYMLKADITKAINEFLKALKISNEIKNLAQIAKLNTNLGMVYARMNNYNVALKYYEESLKIAYQQNNKTQIAYNKLNIAALYIDNRKFKEALNLLLILNDEIDKNDFNLKLPILGNITDCYIGLGNYSEALTFSLNLNLLCEKSKNIKYISQGLNVTAKIYLNLKKYNLSIPYFEKSLGLSQQMQDYEGIKWNAMGLMDAYEKVDNYRNAFKYSKLCSVANDSILNLEKNKEINGLQLAYERDKNEKDKIISAQKAEKQKLLIIGISIIVLILVFTLTYIYRRLQLTRRQKKIIEQQNKALSEKNEEIAAQAEEIAAQRDNLEVFNEELTEKNEEISAQRDSLNKLNNKLTDTNGQLEMLFEIATERKNEIEKKNKDITSSITYASRIQQALLPPSEVLAESLPDHFIIYKPCNIVSGDFYWSKQVDNFIYIVAADCTGHGVPGAFMSMLGISLLNDIVKDKVLMQPHVILNKLRERIKKSLHQTGQKGETQDGMDIAIIVLDLKTKKIDFAGAYNPLYLYRKGTDGNLEFIEAKADRMPIGIHPKDEQSFTSQILQLQPGDSVYLFSDGYISQFGGQKRETFKSRRLQETLMQIQHKPMKEQKQKLEETLANWQGKHEQVDDILMIGLRVN